MPTSEQKINDLRAEIRALVVSADLKKDVVGCGFTNVVHFLQDLDEEGDAVVLFEDKVGILRCQAVSQVETKHLEQLIARQNNAKQRRPKRTARGRSVPPRGSSVSQRGSSVSQRGSSVPQRGSSVPQRGSSVPQRGSRGPAQNVAGRGCFYSRPSSALSSTGYAPSAANAPSQYTAATSLSGFSHSINAVPNTVPGLDQRPVVDNQVPLLGLQSVRASSLPTLPQTQYQPQVQQPTTTIASALLGTATLSSGVRYGLPSHSAGSAVFSGPSSVEIRDYEDDYDNDYENDNYSTESDDSDSQQDRMPKLWKYEPPPNIRLPDDVVISHSLRERLAYVLLCDDIAENGIDFKKLAEAYNKHFKASINAPRDCQCSYQALLEYLDGDILELSFQRALKIVKPSARLLNLTAKPGETEEAIAERMKFQMQQLEAERKSVPHVANEWIDEPETTPGTMPTTLGTLSTATDASLKAPLSFATATTIGCPSVATQNCPAGLNLSIEEQFVLQCHELLKDFPEGLRVGEFDHVFEKLFQSKVPYTKLFGSLPCVPCVVGLKKLSFADQAFRISPRPGEFLMFLPTTSNSSSSPQPHSSGQSAVASIEKSSAAISSPSKSAVSSTFENQFQPVETGLTSEFTVDVMGVFEILECNQDGIFISELRSIFKNKYGHFPFCDESDKKLIDLSTEFSDLLHIDFDATFCGKKNVVNQTQHDFYSSTTVTAPAPTLSPVELQMKNLSLEKSRLVGPSSTGVSQPQPVVQETTAPAGISSDEVIDVFFQECIKLLSQHRRYPMSFNEEMRQKMEQILLITRLGKHSTSDLESCKKAFSTLPQRDKFANAETRYTWQNVFYEPSDASSSAVLENLHNLCTQKENFTAVHISSVWSPNSYFVLRDSDIQTVASIIVQLQELYASPSFNKNSRANVRELIVAGLAVAVSFGGFYHRGLVLSAPHTYNSAWIMLVDFGTVVEVAISNIWLIPKSLVENHAAMAIRARLFGYDSGTLFDASSRRMIEVIDVEHPFSAEILWITGSAKVDAGQILPSMVVSASLCDVSTTDDFYVIDSLEPAGFKDEFLQISEYEYLQSEVPIELEAVKELEEPAGSELVENASGSVVVAATVVPSCEPENTVLLDDLFDPDEDWEALLEDDLKSSSSSLSSASVVEVRDDIVTTSVNEVTKGPVGKAEVGGGTDGANSNSVNGFLGVFSQQDIYDSLIAGTVTLAAVLNYTDALRRIKIITEHAIVNEPLSLEQLIELKKKCKQVVAALLEAQNATCDYNNYCFLNK